jgi:hypothetical protein
VHLLYKYRYFALIISLGWAIGIGIIGCKTSGSIQEVEVSNVDLAIGEGDLDALADSSEDYFEDVFLRYKDHIYDDDIKTVQLHKTGLPLTAPILELNSGESIKLSFDDLGEEQINYYYTIIHCTSNWEDSELSLTDYITGFTDNQITEYAYSFNTLTSFTHFNLEIPNEDLKLALSGNYLLKVYEEDNPDAPVITKRFMVVESRVSVLPRVRKATLLNDKNYKQEVDFTIKHEGYPIFNPYGEIYVVIQQNGRWDNLVKGLAPVFVRDNELIYDYDQDNVFNGCNEFRNFEFKSFRFQSEFIKAYEFDSAGNHVYLYSEKPRPFLKYASHSDINGRMFIRNDEGKDSEVEADYALVHFTLPYEAPMINGNIYVYGGLTNWEYSTMSQLKYNYKKFAYELTLPLKQGYYEYMYVYLEDGQESGDATLIEGSHFDTENEYTIYVYNTTSSGNYHRLIAVKKFDSRY